MELSPARAEYFAGKEFDIGLVHHKRAHYEEAIKHLQNACELYTSLARQTQSSERKLDYLKMQRECLQKIQIDSFMGDYTEDHGHGYWGLIVRKKSEVEKEISALEAEIRATPEPTQ